MIFIVSDKGMAEPRGQVLELAVPKDHQQEEVDRSSYPFLPNASFNLQVNPSKFVYFLNQS